MKKILSIIALVSLVGCSSAPQKLTPIDNSMPTLIRTGVVKTLALDSSMEPKLMCNSNTPEVCYIKYVKKQDSNTCKTPE